MVGHVGFVLTFYFSALTLKDPAEIPTLEQHFLIVPIGMVIGATPLFPGGAGIAELGYGTLYKLLGKSPADGVLGSLVQRVITWVLAVIGFMVFMRMRPTLQPAVEPAVPSWPSPRPDLVVRHSSRRLQ
jgi:uncharacterized membrane protein YbhN (UPF0104 family)